MSEPVLHPAVNLAEALKRLRDDAERTVQSAGEAAWLCAELSGRGYDHRTEIEALEILTLRAQETQLLARRLTAR